MYHKKPAAYLLHIKGYEWEFMKDMTPEARKNLEEAAGFLKKKILEYKNKYHPRKISLSCSDLCSLFLILGYLIPGS